MKVSIQPGAPITAPLSFVMPRSVPGHYSSSAVYDKFIMNLYAINDRGDLAVGTTNYNRAARGGLNSITNDFYRMIVQIFQNA